MISPLARTNNDISTIRLLANVTMVSALLPYMSPFAITSMDVQPTAMIVSLMVLGVIIVLVPTRLALCRDDLVLIGIALLTLLYVDFTHVRIDFNWLRSCAPILLGFPTYLAVRFLYRFISPRLFVGVVCFYSAALFFQLLFPHVFSSLFGHFLSDMRWSPDEGRGPNGLCPEPSMLADMCILFALALYFFHPEYWQSHRKQGWLVISLSSTMLLISKSGTGVVLAVVLSVVGLFNSRLSRKSKVLISIALVLIATAIGPVLNASKPQARGTAVFAALASNPLLLLQDPSLATRCLTLFVGLYELPEAPFGNGGVVVNSKATLDAINSDAGKFLWPTSLVRDYLSDLILTRDRNTGVGNIIQRMGVFGIAILVSLLALVRGFRGSVVVRVFLIGYLLNSTLFVSSLWFVIGCCVAHRNTLCGSPVLYPLGSDETLLKHARAV